MTRDPVAEIGDDDYRVVRHTHDETVARQLMAAEMIRESGCEVAWAEQWRDGLSTVHTCTAGCLDAVTVGEPRRVWMRIVPCPPGSYGAGNDWALQYWECEPGRGAFPAVVFS